MVTDNEPRLFGINNSNRDFSNKADWGKNKFNSSFPAALIAYMGAKNIPCVYLKVSPDGRIQKEYIAAEQLFHVHPLSDNLFYSFESTYTPYQPITVGTAPRVDLMLMEKTGNKIYAGYEVKLTT